MRCCSAMHRCDAARPPLRPAPGVRTGLAAALCVALLVAGCAGRGRVAGDTARASAIEEVALFPLGVVLPLPPGLEDAAPVVDAAIRAYLASRDERVWSPTREDAQAAWLASAQALRREVGESQMGFEGAASILARRLAAERRFDALVLPWIALRVAKVRGRTVTWDGVRRKLRVVNPQKRGLQDLKDFEAQAAAPSLQIAVFSPDGREIFQGVGGLDLLHALVVEGEPMRVDAQLLPRSEIFADRAAIDEGVALALDPLLPAR